MDCGWSRNDLTDFIAVCSESVSLFINPFSLEQRRNQNVVITILNDAIVTKNKTKKQQQKKQQNNKKKNKKKKKKKQTKLIDNDRND